VGAAQGGVARRMSDTALLAVVTALSLVVVALGWPMAWLWRRTILLRGRRRRGTRHAAWLKGALRRQ
jgi:hypothetical protein